MTSLNAPFQKGEKVFVASYTSSERRMPCPDCNGSMKVKLVCHDGREEEVECTACKYGYEHRGTIEIFDFSPLVEELTVGSIRYDDGRSEESPWSFMCIETGVGSGTVHKPERMSKDREEALKIATVLADTARLNVERQNEERLSQRRNDRYRKEEYIRERSLLARVRELEAALSKAQGET